jgi:hypothetical protein
MLSSHILVVFLILNVQNIVSRASIIELTSEEIDNFVKTLDTRVIYFETKGIPFIIMNDLFVILVRVFTIDRHRVSRILSRIYKFRLNFLFRCTDEISVIYGRIYSISSQLRLIWSTVWEGSVSLY